eukprot:TRINITY_DN4360_c0_g1_i1.p1 TRINITY_DN4360_c0_g1~~TRINITY_DN4360_c0_g1_i1.p1  ORF type:complete len:826 (+),score=172.60 TRINITY_DN4360_c0_g1_i1:71-2479(+)
MERQGSWAHNIYEQPDANPFADGLVETFECCGKGTWKAFERYLRAEHKTNATTLFLRGEEEVMEVVLSFLKAETLVDLKTQAKCLAASGRAVRAPSPFPENVTRRTRDRLKRQSDEYQELRDRDTETQEKLQRLINSSKKWNISKKCDEQLELVKRCLACLEEDEENKREGAVRYGKAVKRVESSFKEAAKKLKDAMIIAEGGMADLLSMQSELCRVLPKLNKQLLLLQLSIGDYVDMSKISSKAWADFDLSPQDFHNLGVCQVRSGITLKSPTFTKAKFPPLRFGDGILLRGVTFDRCDLSDVTFGPDLQEVSFKNCKFRQPFDFSSKLLMKTSLESCQLSGANFTDALLNNTVLIFSNCRNCDFTKARSLNIDLRHATASYSNFEKQSLSDSTLHTCKLDNCNMREIIPPRSFDNCDLSGAVLDDVNLSATSMSKVKLSCASLKRAILPTGMDFRTIDVTDADFTDATLTQCNFSGCDLSRSIFKNAKVKDCIFTRAVLPSEEFACQEMMQLPEEETVPSPVNREISIRRKRVSCARNYFAAVAEGGAVFVVGDFQGMPLRDIAVEVAASDEFCMALLQDGTVQVWNCHGMDINSDIDTWTGINTIAASKSLFGGVTSSGRVMLWRPGDAPIPSPDLPRVQKIAISGDIVYAILMNGQLKAWGSEGECSVAVPEGKIVDISVSANHGFVVYSNGKLVSLLETEECETPFITNVSAVACGLSHGIALTLDNHVICWGRNNVCQGEVPEFLSMTEVAAVSAGDFFNVAQLYDGSIIVWGGTDNGDISQYLQSGCPLPQISLP